MAGAIDVVVRTRVPQVVAGIRANAELIVEKIALDFQAKAQQKAPVDTALLRNSIKAVRVGPLEWRIISPVNYSQAVEYGSAPHLIRARNKAALFWPGAAHPVKEVHHPGAAAQPYMTPTAEELRPVFRAAMQRLIP